MCMLFKLVVASGLLFCSQAAFAGSPCWESVTRPWIDDDGVSYGEGKMIKRETALRHLHESSLSPAEKSHYIGMFENTNDTTYTAMIRTATIRSEKRTLLSIVSDVHSSCVETARIYVD